MRVNQSIIIKNFKKTYDNRNLVKLMKKKFEQFNTVENLKAA